MYELYGFTAQGGAFKGQRVSMRAGWQGNAYAGSAIFIGEEQLNDNAFKLILKEVKHLVKEQTLNGLYEAMAEAWAPKPESNNLGFI